MTTWRPLVPGGVVALLVLLVTAGVPWAVRLAAAIAVGAVVAVPRRLPVATGAALLALVVLVGVARGPYVGASSLLVAVPATWAVVLLAARHAGPPHAAPRDRGTWLRAAAGELVAVGAAVPLAILVAVPTPTAPAMAAVAAAALLALGLFAIRRRDRHQPPPAS